MAVADILITPARIWTAPVGEALPARDSVAYGAAWAGNWVDAGLTTSPLAMSRNVTEFELDVQQFTNPVKRIITNEEIMFEATLAESTGANLALVFGGTLTTAAAASGTVGYEQVAAGGGVALSQYTVGFEGLYQDSSNNKFPLRVQLFIATVTLNGQLTFSKSDAAGLPTQFKSLVDTAKTAGQATVLFEKVTAAALP